MFFTPFLIICLLHSSKGYSSGAPDSRCDTMEPGHWVKSQTIPSPYNIEVSSFQVQEGDRVSINLTSTEGQLGFKGFLIMFKRPDDEMARNFGTFDIFKSDNFKAKGLNCFARENSAMTHKENAEKRFVHLEWIAPKVYEFDPSITQEILELKVTFVQDFYTVWTNQSPANYFRITKKKILNPVLVISTYSSTSGRPEKETTQSPSAQLIPQFRDAESDFRPPNEDSNSYQNLNGSWEYFKRSWKSFLQYFGF